MMPKRRRRVTYSGRVQGVGFRYTCERLAKGFPVSGSVRNQADGTVELVAEGEPEPLDAFLAAIQAAMGRKIQNIDVQEESPSERPEESFTIRY